MKEENEELNQQWNDAAAPSDQQVSVDDLIGIKQHEDEFQGSAYHLSILVLDQI